MSKQEKENGIKHVPVQDMPDFMAALEDYGTILIRQGVLPTDAETNVIRIIDKVNKRKQANNFINFVQRLSREIENGNGNHPEEATIFNGNGFKNSSPK